VPVQRFLVTRLTQSILVLFGVTLLVFFMVRFTGDPAALMLSREASPAAMQAFRKSMGFDRPLLVQFVDFVGRAAVGDFGNSLHYKTATLPLILERLPATLQLAGVAMLLAIAIAFPLGLLGGARPGSAWDAAARAIGLLGQSVPNFWLALLMILVFAVTLGWFPAFGRDDIRSVVMPAFVLGLGPMGQMVRLMRSAVLEIRSEDYVRTAYSKGLPTLAVYTKHILRNAAIPLISVLGIQFGYLLGGSIYIETIFAWPGLGRMIGEAVSNRDFPLVQAIALFSCVVVLILNFLTDLAYAVIDPRIRYGS
jgi:ABC-type dipeptide/oligopeptide/nickel transport system permease component